MNDEGKNETKMTHAEHSKRLGILDEVYETLRKCLSGVSDFSHREKRKMTTLIMFLKKKMKG